MYTYIIKDFDFENNVINCSDTENKNIVLHINNLFSFDKVYINNISLNDFDYLLLKNNIKTHKIIVEKIRNEIEMWDNEVMYWRKFNAIHNWFVENVQNSIDDCGDYLVSKEKLTNLVNLINEILFPINCNICKEKEIIEKLLPPKSGFFFGSTDIDDYFIRNLKDTYTDLKEVLNTFDFKSWIFTTIVMNFKIKYCYEVIKYFFGKIIILHIYIPY